MELENKIKCVLMDFEINEITLQEATNRILLLLDVVGQSEQLCDHPEAVVRDTVHKSTELMEGPIYLAHPQYATIKLHDGCRIAIWRNMGQISFERLHSLDAEYYIGDGYTEITREEFDREYVKAVEKLNQFAAL